MLSVLALSVAAAMPALAANPQPQADVLILGSTVKPDPTTGVSSEEAAARSLGLSVEVASDATWASKTAADFGAYKAVVLGDPTCSSFDPTPVSVAVANTTVWGPAVTGNVIVMGADPAFHAVFDINPDVVQAAQAVIANGIQFATSSASGTGAYVSLSCYYSFAEANTKVPLLNAFGPNQFTVTGDINGQCFNQAHIVATHPALAGLTDTSLSSWNCSVHEAFDHFSSAFVVLAVAVDDTNSLLIASDPTSGSPYILARGFDAGATPELDSLLLFGSGLAGGVAYLRVRRRGRQPASKPG
jgi:hypothetical protein